MEFTLKHCYMACSLRHCDTTKHVFTPVNQCKSHNDLTAVPESLKATYSLLQHYKEIFCDSQWYIPKTLLMCESLLSLE